MHLRLKPRGLKALCLVPVLAGTAAGGIYSSLPVQAAAAKGSIEICKSKANGMTGRTFTFTYTDKTGAVGSVNVEGGQCSTALSVAGGQVTVSEAATGNTVVQSITLSPTGRKVSIDTTTGTAVVRAPAGGTETVITFVNKVPPAQLKVCKQAASNSTQLVGQPFSFSINGGAATTIDAGPYGAPNCTSLKTYAAGTNVTVTELQPAAGVFVSEIDVTQPPATNVVTNLTARSVSLTVGSGVQQVTFTNAITVSAQDGYVEICKYAEDEYVGGRFSFTITDAAGLSYGPYSVLTGQCTPAIEVTSGPATITEAAQAPYYLQSTYVVPYQNFISQNLTNGTVRVNVAAGDPTTETNVEFWNATEFGFNKVCKALDSANSDALAGDEFWFDYSVALSTGGTESGDVGVVANTFEQGPACQFLNYDGYPLGSVITISEDLSTQPNIDVSPSTATVTVPGSWNPNGSPGNNITSTTFTNQAEGTIEICKVGADITGAETVGNGHNPFKFVVNGSIDVTVNAGQCSNAIQVPAGTATINELPSTNFHFVSATATGPALDNRIVSGPTTSASGTTVTVSVPFSGEYLDGNETLVTYTNAVNTGVFKICKASSSSTLQGSGFLFNWSYTLNTTTYLGSVTVAPGQCGYVNGTPLSPEIPVVDNNGNPVTVYVSGDTDAGGIVPYYISSITFNGPGLLTSASIADSDASFTIGQGTNAITYDNEACNESGCPGGTGLVR